MYEETEVNINDGTIYHAVYGGGTMASVGQIETSDGTPTGTPYYYSYDDETLADAETGYLKLKPTTEVPNNGQTVVNIRGGVIGTEGTNSDGNGNVFGSAKGFAGAEFKHFAYTGNTDVNISGGKIKGSACLVVVKTVMCWAALTLRSRVEKLVIPELRAPLMATCSAAAAVPTRTMKENTALRQVG